MIKYTIKEWQELKKEVDKQFRTFVLGEYPTYKQIAKQVPNKYSMNAIQKLMWPFLAVLTFVTAFKLWFAAMPFAKDMALLLSHGENVNETILVIFQTGTGILFILFGTIALIYFTILAQEQYMVQLRKKSARMTWKVWEYFTLNWITPRLPLVLVYLIIFVLILISTTGKNDPLTLLLQYIPVIGEIALAHFVAEYLQKQANRRKELLEVLDTHKRAYDKRYAMRETDNAWLRLLYNAIVETLPYLRRRQQGRYGKFEQPNLGMKHYTPEQWYTIVKDIYNSYTLNPLAGENKKINNNNSPAGTTWLPQELALYLYDIYEGKKIKEGDIREAIPNYKETRAIKAWREGGKDIYFAS